MLKKTKGMRQKRRYFMEKMAKWLKQSCWGYTDYWKHLHKRKNTEINEKKETKTKRPNKKEIHEQVKVKYFHRNKEINKKKKQRKNKRMGHLEKTKNKEVKRRFFQTTNFISKNMNTKREKQKEMTNRDTKRDL